LGTNVAWSSWACAWDVGFGTYIVANLGSWSGLWCTFSFLAWAVLSFWLIVVFFEDRDWSWNIEGSFGNLLFLGWVLSSWLGFTNFSLISHGVFIWDNDVLGSNLCLWSSWFWGKFSEWSSSWLGWENGVLRSNVESWSRLVSLSAFWHWCWGTLRWD